MTQGWTCPVCGRGVSPAKGTCDHGNDYSYIVSAPVKSVDDGMCDACRPPNGSGICGCYRPERDGINFGTGRLIKIGQLPDGCS